MQIENQKVTLRTFVAALGVSKPLISPSLCLSKVRGFLDVVTSLLAVQHLWDCNTYFAAHLREDFFFSVSVSMPLPLSHLKR